MLDRLWKGSPARWLALGALGGVAASALVFGGSPTPPTPSVAPAPAAVEQVPESERVPALPAGVRRRPVAAAPSPARAAGSGLEREVVALDAARAALAARAPGRALELLGEYAKAFPRGQLALEAEVIAIRALEMQGLWSQADERANAYLMAHPDDPHAAALRRRGEALLR